MPVHSYLQSEESRHTSFAQCSNKRFSRASLRNWRDRDPALNRAFDTFEANKVKQEAKRQKIRHFKEVASGILDA